MKESWNAIDFLLRVGLLTDSDAGLIRDSHVETVTAILARNTHLHPSEVQELEHILAAIATAPNRIRRAHAQVDFMRAISRNLDRRVDAAGESIATSRRRISGPAVPVVALASSGKRSG